MNTVRNIHSQRVSGGENMYLGSTSKQVSDEGTHSVKRADCTYGDFVDNYPSEETPIRSQDEMTPRKITTSVVQVKIIYWSGNDLYCAYTFTGMLYFLEFPYVYFLLLHCFMHCLKLFYNENHFLNCFNVQSTSQLQI